MSAHDDDLVRRGDVRKAFADYSSVLDDFNEELDKVPATFRVGECPVCSCTIIPGGCTAEKCRHPELVKVNADLMREVERLTRLAYIGDHHFPDLTYKARLEELVPKCRAAEPACGTCDGVNASWVRCPECGAGGA